MESSIVSLLILFAPVAPRTPQSEPARTYNPLPVTRDQMVIRGTYPYAMQQQQPPLPIPEPSLIELANFASQYYQEAQERSFGARPADTYSRMSHPPRAS